MKIKRFVFGVTLTILSISSAAKLYAADASLVERAKKEGTFMLYSSMNAPDVNYCFPARASVMTLSSRAALLVV